jgi:secreted protein with Ig-like and vWFA domain
MLSADINFNSELINGSLRETVDINIHFVMFHVKLINPPKILVQAYILLYSGAEK